ncbi:phosphate ABC transporter permease PstA [Amedibacillus sp. YH-ame6]
MKQINLAQKKKRKRNDGILNGITYVSSGVSVVVLIAIFIFIFSKGFSSLGFDILTGNYWSNNYLTSIQEQHNAPANFTKPSDLSEGAVFSSKWGVAFIDTIDQHKDNVVLIEYIDKDSPFNYLIDDSIKDREVTMGAEVGFQAERINFVNTQGKTQVSGNIMSQSAKEVVTMLDENAASIKTMYFKTPGGGIRGSIITTLYLIIVSLLIALPLGIAAAIYLHEYAKPTRTTGFIRSAIEMLTGVPSIIFGLMGVAVLFPITQMFGATTANILLGSLTMSVILLPTIIRSTEEALIVVPKSLRDASLSLGANQSQTIFKVILPCAVPGILTGVLLSIGRIIGESAALIYAMGTYVNDSPELLSQGTSLAVHIYNIMSSEQPNFELASAISIVILIFVLVLNISIKLLSKRFNKAWY